MIYDNGWELDRFPNLGNLTGWELDRGSDGGTFVREEPNLFHYFPGHFLRQWSIRLPLHHVIISLEKICFSSCHNSPPSIPVTPRTLFLLVPVPPTHPPPLSKSQATIWSWSSPNNLIITLSFLLPGSRNPAQCRLPGWVGSRGIAVNWHQIITLAGGKSSFCKIYFCIFVNLYIFLDWVKSCKDMYLISKYTSTF